MFNAVTRSVNQLVKLNTLKRIESSSKWCLPASKRNLINAQHEIKLIDRLEQQKSFVNRFDNELRLLLNCGQQSDANQEADFRLEDHVRNEILTDLRQIEEELHELIRLQQNESDQLEQLIHDECGHLNQKVTDLLDRVVDLLTVDRLDHVQEVVVELEHAVGGQESMLFVKEMNNFYVQFASQNGWKVLSNHFPSESESGGYRAAEMRIQGADVFRWMQHEAGVHRVQRVPKTERNGRIHTSTISVRVVPIFRQEELHLDKSALRIETMRSQGAGGQNVNKTETCVRIVHIPTGLAVECQEQRSQEQNRAVAMQKLIVELSRRRSDQMRLDERRIRRNQVQTVERSDKIRTYNYPQDRITEHRLRHDLLNLRAFMKGECGQALTEWHQRLDRHRKQSLRDEILSRLKLNPIDCSFPDSK